MLSFWEKQSFLYYDYLIVGSGIVGLSTASSLIEKEKNAKILVLERGIFPTGASTKNAGFACFGSLTEILADLRTMPAEQVVSLVSERYHGLLGLRKRLGDTQIGFLQYGGYELISEKELPALNKIDSVNDLLFPIFKSKVYAIKNEQIQEFGFDKNFTKSLIFNPYEGQIDTGKMMQSLLRYVQSKGVMILNQCEVTHIEDSHKQATVKVWVRNHLDKEDIAFSARKVIVCTNAFTPQLFPTEDIFAGRGQVLVTEPIANLKIKGTFHFDEGFYYFRNFENRLIFGGGRNIDFQAENTLEIATTPRIMNDLEEKLRMIILPNTSYQIAHRWAGIMAFGNEKKPIVKYHSANIILAVRMGGMGIAIGTQIGKQVLDLISN
jgi:glycine/D-amino acid oxidase-like deaminating enzyme